jgi:hypothetical protein
MKELQDLYIGLVNQGYIPTTALEIVNRMSGMDFSICQYCYKYGATEYEYEGSEWVVCSVCELNQALNAEAQADALMGK